MIFVCLPSDSSTVLFSLCILAHFSSNFLPRVSVLVSENVTDGWRIIFNSCVVLNRCGRAHTADDRTGNRGDLDNRTPATTLTDAAATYRPTVRSIPSSFFSSLPRCQRDPGIARRRRSSTSTAVGGWTSHLGVSATKWICNVRTHRRRGAQPLRPQYFGAGAHPATSFQ